MRIFGFALFQQIIFKKLRHFAIALSRIGIRGSFMDIKINGVEVVLFTETDSTNSRAKTVAKQGYKSPMLFVAEHQTAGRGRMGRSFYSPASTGLYMSYLYKIESEISDSVAVTGAAAVAVVRAIKELTLIEPHIKWVNDIFISGKKVCGILTEAVTDKNGVTSVVVGIGINVATADFPEELKSVAGSLGVALNREDLAKSVIKHLQRLISELPKRTYLEDYKTYSCVLGREVVYVEKGAEFKAKAVDIDENGGLVVIDQNGNKKTLSTGKISVKLM